jgi:hypothetical protein
MKIYKSDDVELESFVIINSATVKVGDAVKLVAGGLDIADATNDYVYGVVDGIVDRKGIPLDKTIPGVLLGTWTSSTMSYVAANSNQTVDMVEAQIRSVTDDNTITALLDDVPGTTTGSNKPGYFLSILTSDASKLDESTAHATTQQQYITVDNGQHNESCLDPVLGGNWVLVKAVFTEVPRASQS